MHLIARKISRSIPATDKKIPDVDPTYTSQDFLCPRVRPLPHNALRMTPLKSRTNQSMRHVSIFAILGLVVACGGAPPPKSQPSELLQRVMPMFSTTSLNGTAIDTGGFDSPIVVKFFDADCAACARTLPAAQGLYKQK